MKDEAPNTDIIPLEPNAIVAAFQADDLSPIIGRIRDEVDQHQPDLTTAKGRQQVKSLAYKVVRSKTLLDNAGKELTEDARKQIDAVNAQRRKVRDELDALADKVRKPLTEWQEAEDARKARHKAAMDAFDLDATSHTMSAADIAAIVAEVEAIDVGPDWEEFEADAHDAKQRALTKFKADLESATVRETQEAKIAALQAEKEEREAKERAETEARLKREALEQEAREAKEAEERVALEAAERDAREKAEAEEHAAKVDAEQKAYAERLARHVGGIARGEVFGEPKPYSVLHHELTVRVPSQKDETGPHWATVLHAIADAKIALHDMRIEEEARQKKAREEEQKRIADEAAEAERQRAADEAARVEAERAARAANKERRQKVLDAIGKALADMKIEDMPQAMAEGEIPHVHVSFD